LALGYSAARCAASSSGEVVRRGNNGGKPFPVATTTRAKLAAKFDALTSRLTQWQRKFPDSDSTSKKLCARAIAFTRDTSRQLKQPSEASLRAYESSLRALNAALRDWDTLGEPQLS
jgi:hypothetical protein